MNKLKIVGILQARMGSRRFPGKTLMCIKGEPLLKRIINLQKNTSLLDEYFVATSDLKIDDPIEEVCKKMGVNFYRGSEKNVLSRFINISNQTHADILVRLTADNLFVDEDLINFVLKSFLENKDNINYACTSVKSGFPFGLFVEAFYARELNKYQNTKNKNTIEHVTYEMKKKINRKNFLLVKAPLKCNTNINLSIDYKSDLKSVEGLLKYLNKKKKYNFLDVLKSCNELKL